MLAILIEGIGLTMIAFARDLAPSFGGQGFPCLLLPQLTSDTSPSPFYSLEEVEGVVGLIWGPFLNGEWAGSVGQLVGTASVPFTPPPTSQRWKLFSFRPLSHGRLC